MDPYPLSQIFKPLIPAVYYHAIRHIGYLEPERAILHSIYVRFHARSCALSGCIAAGGRSPGLKPRAESSRPIRGEEPSEKAPFEPAVYGLARCFAPTD